MLACALQNRTEAALHLLGSVEACPEARCRDGAPLKQDQETLTDQGHDSASGCCSLVTKLCFAPPLGLVLLSAPSLRCASGTMLLLQLLPGNAIRKMILKEYQWSCLTLEYLCTPRKALDVLWCWRFHRVSKAIYVLQLVQQMGWITLIGLLNEERLVPDCS